MPQSSMDDKSTLVQVIAWCRQATTIICVNMTEIYVGIRSQVSLEHQIKCNKPSGYNVYKHINWIYDIHDLSASKPLLKIDSLHSKQTRVYKIKYRLRYSLSLS